MAQVEYNLVDDILRYGPDFYRAFRRVPFPFANLQSKSISYDEVPAAIELELEAVESAIGPLGTPMLFPITLAGWRIPGPTLINLTGGKQMVITPMNGGKGSVKQITNSSDRRFTIRGFLLGQAQEAGGSGAARVVTNAYPKEGLKKLIEICDTVGPLEIICEYLKYFKIYQCVIENFSLPQVEGMDDMIPFELSCISDIPFDVVYNPTTVGQ